MEQDPPYKALSLTVKDPSRKSQRYILRLHVPELPADTSTKLTELSTHIYKP